MSGELSLSVLDLLEMYAPKDVQNVHFLGAEEYVCMAPHPNLEWHIIALAGSCSGLEFIDHYWTTKVRSEVFLLLGFHIARPHPIRNGSPCTRDSGLRALCRANSQQSAASLYSDSSTADSCCMSSRLLASL